jgi:hypothetical protein
MFGSPASVTQDIRSCRDPSDRAVRHTAASGAARQAEAFLRARGTELPLASRADLEAFMGELARRSPATAATYHKVLRILYAWLAEDGEIPGRPAGRP